MKKNDEQNGLFSRVKDELHNMEHVKVLVEKDGLCIYDFLPDRYVIIISYCPENMDPIFDAIHAFLKTKNAGLVEVGLIGGLKSARKVVKRAKPKGVFSKHNFYFSHLTDDMKLWKTEAPMGPSLPKILKSVRAGKPLGAAPQPMPPGKLAKVGAVFMFIVIAFLYLLLKFPTWTGLLRKFAWFAEYLDL